MAAQVVLRLLSWHSSRRSDWDTSGRHADWLADLHGLVAVLLLLLSESHRLSHRLLGVLLLGVLLLWVLLGLHLNGNLRGPWSFFWLIILQHVTPVSDVQEEPEPHSKPDGSLEDDGHSVGNLTFFLHQVGLSGTDRTFACECHEESNQLNQKADDDIAIHAHKPHLTRL